MRSGLSWGSSVLLASTPACAAPLGDNEAIAVGAALAVTAVALLIGQWLWLGRRRIGAETRADRLRVELARIQAAQEAVPGGFVAFADGALTVSAGLDSWLGLGGPIQILDDLAPAFGSAAFNQFRAAAEALRDRGTAFALDLTSADGSRIVEAIGHATGAAAVVTLRDATAEHAARRRNAAALAEVTADRDRWRAILDAAPFPIWRRGQDLKLTWCNRTYAEMVEAQPDDVVARNIELASRLEPGQPRELARRAAETGATANEARRFVVAGDRRSYRISEAPLAAGVLVGFGQDITPEEEVRADLARHVDAHAEVLQNLATAIAVYGPDKRLILHNRAFAQLWQLDESWLAEKPTVAEILEHLRENRLLPEQVDWQAFKRAQVELFTAVIEPREEMLHLPDGRTLRLLVNPHPFGGLSFTYEDVTDQLVLERARNTLVAVQRATLDNLYEGVVVYGSDGRVDLFNKAFVRLWGLSDSLLAGEPHISEVVDACRPLLDDGKDWEGQRDRMIGRFAERIIGTGRLDRPDGAVIDFAGVPLPDGAMLFTYLDVTDSSRIERALRERNEALQAADQLKSEFISNVSYELRTPLNTIIGFAEILANQYFGPLNERQLEYSQGILDSSHQLLILINDILDLATIEAGHMTLEPESFDLHATLVAILALVRERARRQNLTLEFQCPAEIGWIVADERRIKQVLFNLMSNAIKFTPPGGAVTLGARRQADQVALWVKDTGLGIPAEDRERVFEKFQKSRAGIRQPGAGLGLALVRSFIELHGGRVELESAPERGTTITCWLPGASSAVEPASVASAVGQD